MRGGYLATESLQSADKSWGMCFEQRRPVSTHGRGLFPAMVNPANEKKKKTSAAGNLSFWTMREVITRTLRRFVQIL